MNVEFFLKERTAFIRQFYERAAPPFAERLRKIEAREEPFVPPYSEDGEPPFLDEWMEADESLQILGYACLSMLSAALHLYFKEWEAELRRPAAAVHALKPIFKKKGWLNGYKAYFADWAGIRFEDGPADLALLQELVLTRNEVQHPRSITDQVAYHPARSRAELSRAFFLRDSEKKHLADLDEANSEPLWFLHPRVHVTSENLMTAIFQVESFCEWLEAEIVARIHGRSRSG